MWKRGSAQWYISAESGGVEVATPVFAGMFLRYPVEWGVTLALGHLFRPPVARWSGRLSTGGGPTPEWVDPNPIPQPEPDPAISKVGPDA